jgi:hypothetical protein
LEKTENVLPVTSRGIRRRAVCLCHSLICLSCFLKIFLQIDKIICIQATANRWRKIYNEEIHTLCCSLNTIPGIKLRSGAVRLVRYASAMNDKTYIYKYIQSQLKNVTGTCHIGDLTLDGKVILKWILKK